jgi:SHS2 domain-containing protein
MYEVFEHTADVGLRMRADSLEQLLQDAGRGLFSLIVTNLDDVQAVCQRSYRIPREEDDYLLFDWLSELLYTFESEQLLLCEFQLRLQPAVLTANCRGETMDLERHQMHHEVKAITYHGLVVDQIDGRWLAEVIVDI